MIDPAGMVWVVVSGTPEDWAEGAELVRDRFTATSTA